MSGTTHSQRAGASSGWDAVPDDSSVTKDQRLPIAYLQPELAAVDLVGPHVAEELEVLATRLDGVVLDPIDVLKLDLQGYELEALRGLGERLQQVRTILTEAEFVPLFEGQPLFGDVDAALRKAGFRLFHLYDVWSHADGQVTSADALYVNERFYA